MRFDRENSQQKTQQYAPYLSLAAEAPVKVHLRSLKWGAELKELEKERGRRRRRRPRNAKVDKRTIFG
jgi:hypothetical protein